LNLAHVAGYINGNANKGGKKKTGHYSCLEKKKPLLMRIDRILDFSFIRELTKKKCCKNNGRSSIDPEFFFR